MELVATFVPHFANLAKKKGGNDFPKYYRPVSFLLFGPNDSRGEKEKDL